jgi:hypothetical protein
MRRNLRLGLELGKILKNVLIIGKLSLNLEVEKKAAKPILRERLVRAQKS